MRDEERDSDWHEDKAHASMLPHIEIFLSCRYLSSKFVRADDRVTHPKNVIFSP